jgi:hypothetical protein
MQAHGQGFVSTHGNGGAHDGIGMHALPATSDFLCFVRETGAGAMHPRTSVVRIDPGGGIQAWTALPLPGSTFMQCSAALPSGGAASFVAGGSVIRDGRSDHDPLLAFFDANGTLLLQSAPMLSGDQQVLGLCPMDDGGVVACGMCAVPGGPHQPWVARFGPTAALMWQISLPAPLSAELRSVALIQGDLFVAGRGVNFSGSSDATLARLSAQGDVTWTSSWGGSGDEDGRVLLPLGNEGFVVAGTTRSHGPYDPNLLRNRDRLFIAAFNLEGDTLWSSIIGSGPYDRSLLGVSQAPNGDLVLSGKRSDLPGSSDALLIRAAPGGTPLWERTWETGNEAWLYASEALADGIAACGSSFGPAGRQLLLVKRDANGN